MGFQLIQGDSRRLPLADGSVHLCVTSPPYFNLRSYLPEGDPKKEFEVGLEATPELYVATMVEVFREVRRVLRDDGVLFLNIGDGYNSSPPGNKKPMSKSGLNGAQSSKRYRERLEETQQRQQEGRSLVKGYKPKDLLGVPWQVAFALRADGWYLRDAIIWSKAEVDEDGAIEGSVMPGSYEDRCTFAYEPVFMLSKKPRYYFDRLAVTSTSGSPLRNVWRINTESSRYAHYAAMPRELVRRCVALGTSEKGCCPNCGSPWVRQVEKDRQATRPGTGSKVNGIDGETTGNRDPGRHTTTYRTVGWNPSCSCNVNDRIPCTILDNFVGSGTTLVVTEQLGRSGVGVDLNPEYLTMARQRLTRPHAPIKKASKSEKRYALLGEEA